MTPSTQELRGLLERANAQPKYTSDTRAWNAAILDLQNAQSALKNYNAYLPALLDRIERLEADNTTMRAALEPFARADRALGNDPGPYRLQTDKGYREIDRKAFRAARAALGSVES